ncbi:hypothetical protein D9M68_779880 [compost metagenome]
MAVNSSACADKAQLARASLSSAWASRVCAATLAGVAQITRSNASSTPSPVSCHRPAWASSPVMRAPVRRRVVSPWWLCSQCAAAAGNRLVRSVRGSSRLDALKPAAPRPNRASRMTFRKTAALACAEGRLSAETHSGSISSCTTRSGKDSHSSSTVSVGVQRKPASCQPSDARISARRSPQRHPRAVAMAASASSGAGQRVAQAGVCRPVPSG